MSRNIVLCFDGTDNEYAAANTNVVKLYQMLDRNSSNQISYYQPGIGTMPPPGVWDSFKKSLITRLDLAVAWLLDDHVCDGYRFLMRYYRPGDQIYIFGFSRGAYSARVLAGMLQKIGLLTSGNEELISFAWDIYKKHKNWDESDGFRDTFSRKAKVHFLGLWDTVSSVGWLFSPQAYDWTARNEIVSTVRHAVSLDEKRAFFRQNLWKEVFRGQDVLEVWFPGVHCDVGGGYRDLESGLSKIALQWMVVEAVQKGLVLDHQWVSKILPTANTAKEAAPNPLAMMHESLKCFWKLVEHIPKRYGEGCWLTHIRRHPFGQPRSVPEGANIHASVFDRMNASAVYKPTNLPAKFEKVGNSITGQGVGAVENWTIFDCLSHHVWIALGVVVVAGSLLSGWCLWHGAIHLEMPSVSHTIEALLVLALIWGNRGCFVGLVQGVRAQGAATKPND